MFKIWQISTAIALLFLSIIYISLAGSQDNLSWQQIGSGKDYGISGIALVKQEKEGKTFIVVHDNKKESSGIRFGSIDFLADKPPIYLPLKLPDSQYLPMDLEAITNVPETVNPTFMTLSSDGTIYQFTLDQNNQKISWLGKFNLPKSNEKNKFEGLAIQKINGQAIALWVYRGKNDKPGILYWGNIELKNNRIIPQGSVNLSFPFPSPKIRHLADLKVDEQGNIYTTAVADYGDEGPFSSAVYLAGKLNLTGKKINFTANSSLTPLYTITDHKVEALEILPGKKNGFVLGSDDENLGGFIKIIKSE